MTWNLSDAKDNLSEVLSKAATEGPQMIQRQDECYVVLPRADYDKLARHPSFKDWLLNGPPLTDVDLPREPSAMREVEL